MRIKESLVINDIDTLSDIRIDKYISKQFDFLSRSQLKAKNAVFYINGKESKFSAFVKTGDLVEIEYDAAHEISLKPEKIDLDIIYEDKNITVINKPQGMVVHPAAGNPAGTLANALLYHLKDGELDDNDDIRHGIVHRLDKETSGIIITAKNVFSHEFLSQQFRIKKTRKKYLAVVKGKMKFLSGVIDTYLTRDKKNRKKYQIDAAKNGKRAITNFKVLKEFQDSSLILLEPETGRTHQLRVHMQHVGCPIIGDPLYARKIQKYSDYTMMLHAYTLEIEIPEYGMQRFLAPLPERFKKFIIYNK
jgi:23S rRNA pseudouridine1911/1915/1917 synthase